jgi:hypothetical protein
MICHIMKSIVLLLYIAVMGSCSDTANVKSGTAPGTAGVRDSVSIEQPAADPVRPKETAGFPDTVLTYELAVDVHDKQCSKWKGIPKQDIIRLLKGELTEMSGNDWNACYGDWSCGAEGCLVLDKVAYHYRVDAGGWIILNDGKNQKYYGCKKGAACWKRFPSEYLCPDK